MPIKNNQSVQGWIKRIADNEMPIFGRTVQEVVSVSQDSETSAEQLSQVVLKDAAMTSRVLKLANTVYYKRYEQRISTISRAIMLLGFDAVRSMCLTVALIDGLEQGNSRKHLVREMARSLHAATQARIIATERNDDSPEEIYISTLLYHIGDLAFWCFCDEEEGAKLDEALRQPNVTVAEAQREALGFTLNELSAGLAKIWALSDLLLETLDNPNNEDDRVRSIILSEQIAIASEEGWESEKVHSLTKDIAKFTKLSKGDITEKLHEGARQAAESSTLYGAKLVAESIPQPTQSSAAPLETVEKTVNETPVDYPEPDAAVQLTVLRELTKMTSEATNLNLVMQKILEGIHSGVGMDRALFALMTPDRKSLNVKHAIGDSGQRLQNKFIFNFENDTAEILKFCILEEQSIWLGSNSSADLNNQVSASLTEITGTDEFVISPIMVGGKVIGLYYADRGLSKRTLEQKNFDDFQFFTQQSNMVLNHLTSAR